MKSKKRIPRVFLDTNVFFAGLTYPRWPYEILRYGETEEIEIILCPLVICEIEKNIAKKFPSFFEEVKLFINTGNFKKVANPSKKEIEKHHDLVRDKKDIPIALAAIKAKVDFLVSSDKDLTARDHTTEKLRKYIKPILPGTFLKEVMKWTSEELEAIRYRKWKDLE